MILHDASLALDALLELARGMDVFDAIEVDGEVHSLLIEEDWRRDLRSALELLADSPEAMTFNDLAKALADVAPTTSLLSGSRDKAREAIKLVGGTVKVRAMWAALHEEPAQEIHTIDVPRRNWPAYAPALRASAKRFAYPWGYCARPGAKKASMDLSQRAYDREFNRWCRGARCIPWLATHWWCRDIDQWRERKRAGESVIDWPPLRELESYRADDECGAKLVALERDWNSPHLPAQTPSQPLARFVPSPEVYGEPLAVVSSPSPRLSPLFDDEEWWRGVEDARFVREHLRSHSVMEVATWVVDNLTFFGNLEDALRFDGFNLDENPYCSVVCGWAFDEDWCAIIDEAMVSLSDDHHARQPDVFFELNKKERIALFLYPHLQGVPFMLDIKTHQVRHGIADAMVAARQLGPILEGWQHDNIWNYKKMALLPVLENAQSGNLPIELFSLEYPAWTEPVRRWSMALENPLYSERILTSMWNLYFKDATPGIPDEVRALEPSERLAWYMVSDGGVREVAEELPPQCINTLLDAIDHGYPWQWYDSPYLDSIIRAYEEAEEYGRVEFIRWRLGHPRSCPVAEDNFTEWVKGMTAFIVGQGTTQFRAITLAELFAEWGELKGEDVSWLASHHDALEMFVQACALEYALSWEVEVDVSLTPASGLARPDGSDAFIWSHPGFSSTARLPKDDSTP